MAAQTQKIAAKTNDGHPLTSVKLSISDRLFCAILTARVWWERDNWKGGNTKEEDTDMTHKIRYDKVCGTKTSTIYTPLQIHPASLNADF